MNGAITPRAPVIAFQPLIAAARCDSGVSSLMTAAIPTSIEEPLTPIPTAASQTMATLGASA